MPYGVYSHDDLRLSNGLIGLLKINKKLASWIRYFNFQLRRFRLRWVERQIFANWYGGTALNNWYGVVRGGTGAEN